MKSRSGVLVVVFAVVAGLFGARVPDQPPPMRPVAALVQTVDRALDRAQTHIDAAHAQSTRAVAAAVKELPDISVERKQALLRCIDHHLACNRKDLVDAMEAREAAPDDQLAMLVELEVREYRATERRLTELRWLVETA